MARDLRPDVAGAIHHVTCRGNRRQPIVHDDVDRLVLLEELSLAGEAVGWLLLSYCLMGNHAHLLLECPNGGLSRGMQLWAGRYARRFHRRHETMDHHFGGRFRSKLVKSDEQLLMTVLYIARNPVTAGLCDAAGDWPWSSHRALVHGDPSGLVAVERVAELLGVCGTPGRELYLAAVGDRRLDVPEPVRPPRRPSLTAVVEDGTDASLISAWLDHGYTLREIGRELGCNATTVSRRIRAARNKCA